jgi:hypothetical protein
VMDMRAYLLRAGRPSICESDGKWRTLSGGAGTPGCYRWNTPVSTTGGRNFTSPPGA